MSTGSRKPAPSRPSERHSYTGAQIASKSAWDKTIEFPDKAHALLDIYAQHSRSALLSGEQLICLVQSDDPRFSLPPVGATPLMWNDAEW